MKKIVAALAAAMLLAVVGATTAQADPAWVTTTAAGGPYGPDVSSFQVKSAAKVSTDGLSVTWPVKFTCTRGMTYGLTQFVVQLASPADDSGTQAQADSSGTCTGTPQMINTTIPVTGTVPMQPAPATQVNAEAEIFVGSTGGFVLCQGDPCAEVTTAAPISLR